MTQLPQDDYINTNVKVNKGTKKHEFNVNVHRALSEISQGSVPVGDADLRRRMSRYFKYCEDTGLNLSIEGMCLALGVDTDVFYTWCNGLDCSEERTMLCRKARQYVGAYLEQLMLDGKINPVTGIFFMKNWLSYRDGMSLDDKINLRASRIVATQSVDEILLDLGIDGTEQAFVVVDGKAVKESEADEEKHSEQNQDSD